jgi:OmcA/MtrC family decaheme c-type cytochrome
MCHNPGTTDPNSGNTLDMKVMIHKIHTGNTLPSIQTATAPTPRRRWGRATGSSGYGDSLSNFNTVLYPQDTRNCTTCHVQNHPEPDRGGQLQDGADGRPAAPAMTT